MLREEVDVVGDNHQVANLEGGVHTAGGIRYEERFDAQFVHYTDREGHLLHGVALIIVEAALHGQDVHSAELAEDELSLMSLNGGHREIGYLTIRELQLVSYF